MFSRASLPVTVLLTIAVAAALSAATGPTVEIDASACTIKADQPLVSLGRPNWRAKQFRAGFRNEGLERCAANLKILGLEAQSYDVYVSGKFAGSFSSATLKDGIPVEMSAGLLAPGRRRTLEAYAAILPAAADKMAADKPNWPLWVEYTGESRWLMDIMREDRGDRSAILALVEKGRPTQPNLSVDYLTAQQIAENSSEFLTDLERLRQMVLQKKLSADSEAQHLGWLIPLSVKVAQTAIGGAVTIKVSIENNFDRPVKGAVRLPGTKTNPASSEFDIAPGKSQICSMTLEGAGAVAPTTALVTGAAGPYTFRQTMEQNAASDPVSPGTRPAKSTYP